MVQGRQRFGARGRERVQRAVTTAALEQAEQRTAGRYDRIEHGKQPHIKRRRNRGTRITWPRDTTSERPPSLACCRPSLSASRRWPMRTASRPARCGNTCPAIASVNHDVMMTRGVCCRDRISGGPVPPPPFSVSYWSARRRQWTPNSSRSSVLPNIRAVSTADGVPAEGSAPPSRRALMTSVSPLKTAPASGV